MCPRASSGRLVAVASQERTRSVFDLDRCIFCGGAEMTQEHLISDWVFRAVQKSRHPRITYLRQSDSGDTESQHGPTQLAATVLCRPCNNGWVAELDNAASRLLKPIVCATGPVTLSPQEQRSVGAWALKTAIVNDLPITGGDSRLLETSREMGGGEHEPPDYIEVWAGPPSISLEGDTRVVGVLPQHGEIVLGEGPDAQRITLHVWRLMLGYLDLLVRPLLMWIPLPEPADFVRILPARDAPVVLDPSRAPQGAVRWTNAPAGMTLAEPRA
jgi:hypothetical protein